LEKHSNLGIFDSIHAATAIKINEKLVSTDSIYNDIDEVENIDPRKFSNKIENDES